MPAESLPPASGRNDSAPDEVQRDVGEDESGTTAWKRYRIDARVPADAHWLNFGLVLSGPGVLRADSFSLSRWDAVGSWMEV